MFDYIKNIKKKNWKSRGSILLLTCRSQHFPSYVASSVHSCGERERVNEPSSNKDPDPIRSLHPYDLI